MYYHGRDVPRDYKESVKWFTMAAEQGNGKAQLYMGDIYHKGKGVIEDRVEAYKWFLLAGMYAPEATLEISSATAADRREGLRKYHEIFNPIPLRADQIAEAERRAQAEVDRISKVNAEREKSND